jgi:AraC-like DNA-binding protein
VIPVQLLNTAPDDDVTGLLAALTVCSSVYCLSDLGAPWGFEVDDASTAKFHIVLDGGCWLRLTGADPVWLGHGDLAILPRGERHTVSDSLDSAVRGLDRLIADHPLDADARLNGGGGGARTRLLCGGFTLASPAPEALLALLPQVVTMTPRAAPVSAWIGPVFALARQEADDPARPWTLQALARETSMSRTAFAMRFRAATGESPIQHLAKVRLSQAAAYLTTTDLTLDAIAVRTGYASNASLSKAFKRHFGVSPGSYRETNRGPVSAAAPA